MFILKTSENGKHNSMNEVYFVKYRAYIKVRSVHDVFWFDHR